MTNIVNPYKNVDWTNVERVASFNHVHGRSGNIQTLDDDYVTEYYFNKVYNYGFRHLPFSNYRPSTPSYPLIVKNENGELITIPSDVIQCPNAEHVGINYMSANHFSGLGSTWSSGIVDDPTTEKVESDSGANVSWKYAFDCILKNLQFEDGGGIVINHPEWSKKTGGNLDLKLLKEFLDYDERVIGIEIYNACSSDPTNIWALDWWDNVLITGRKVWGFCTCDWINAVTQYIPLGRSVLLVNDKTEHDCLKAYRDGAFYGQIKNTSLKFKSIGLIGRNLLITTENANYINVIIDGNATQYNTNTVSITVPDDAVYVRAEAHSDDDSIFSNPIIFKPYRAMKNSITHKILTIL